MADRNRFQQVSEPPRIDRCENCSHYAPEVPREMPPTCRKNEPVLIPMAGVGGQMGFAGMWPPIKPQWWCKKWEALTERDLLNRVGQSNNP